MTAPRQAGQAAQEWAHFRSSSLNPEAQRFAIPSDADHACPGALVPRDSIEDQEQIKDLARQLQSMAKTYGDEIMSLRKDVETLKHGGWTVKFSTPQVPNTIHSPEIEATKQRLQQTSKLISNHDNYETRSGSDMKAIEAAPVDKHDDSDSSGTQGVSQSSKEHSSPITSGGLSMSRYAPNQSIAPTKQGQSTAKRPMSSKSNEIQQNGSCNGPPETTLANRIPPNSVRSNATQTPPAPATQTKVTPEAYKPSTTHGNNAQSKQVDRSFLPVCSTPPKAPKSNGVPATKPENDSFADPNTPLPTIEDPFTIFIKKNPNWIPFGVRRLTPVPPKLLKCVPKRHETVTFSWEFIRDLFGGKQWSPGFYYKETKAGSSLLQSRSYYALDASLDPYLPKTPGAHGAKLTAFFNPENPEDVDGEEGRKAFERVPLFITIDGTDGSATDGKKKGKRYVYFGMYSQPRFSDKLDFDRMMEAVPHSVKMHWATTIADPSRPDWVTALLKAHVGDEEKPEYEGPMPDGTANGCKPEEFRSEVFAWIKQLKMWSKKTAKAVIQQTKEDILEAFEREDAACPPGLRLWWEYLACDDYDYSFYDMLIHEQAKFNMRRSGDPKFKQPSTDRSALSIMKEYD